MAQFNHPKRIEKAIFCFQKCLPPAAISTSILQFHYNDSQAAAKLISEKRRFTCTQWTFQQTKD
jgi:hypothetical protein